MAVKFEFYLSDDDTERLFAIKEDKGKDNFTGNDFAKELLQNTLHKMHPSRVRYDDDTGERINKAEIEIYNNLLKKVSDDTKLHKWLEEQCIPLEDFVDLLDDIDNGYRNLSDYRKDPAVFNEEEIEFLKTDIVEWEEKLSHYKTQFMKENPETDWIKEIDDVQTRYKIHLIEVNNNLSE
ncbi:MAG: hypothetical protein J6J86_09690 [Lachnospiraceae bacterium]|nr:hypothetical protein [Lachnospiraceae bacterium]